MIQHFLQSTAWEAFQKTENRKTFRRTGDGFEFMAVLEPSKLGNYLFCPYGPTVKTEKDLETALKALKKLAKQENAFFVRIEPTLSLDFKNQKTAYDFSLENLNSLGLKKSHDLDPKNTWVLNLDQPEEEILKGMEKEKVRLFKSSPKKGISFRKTTDPEEIKTLIKFLESVGERNHIIPQKEDRLKRQLTSGFGTLFIAEKTDENGKVIPLAASLVYDWNKVRYTVHSAADNKHKKLAAGSSLLIYRILDAKKSGAKIFDFWGITTSEDKSHPWYGFTKFKKSFGGNQVDYSGTWDLPLKPARYKLYQVLRKLNRLKRRVTA
ncbi:MAG: peptidoglycan bridge formation glycyltransferase FemA/FemB family protein [Candidatus Saccharibacteria bacterium]|nr:peptidoglycan bridge formation glycyltransferase FemA/FemB family protein [Candidatus Saccharibacteria bacterium]